MKIFLTGASGFVGSHTARVLLNQGHTVYALVRPDSDLWRIQDIISKLEIVKVDLTQKEKIGAQLKFIQPDLCIHLAWCEADNSYLSKFGNVDSLMMSLDLVHELVAAGCRRILMAGTCFEYDTSSSAVLSETRPEKSGSLYAAAKHALHIVTEQFMRGAGAELVWARLFLLFGPFENEGRLVPSVILPLLRNETAKLSPGAQIRDYLYVKDAAEAICALAVSRFTGTINVASGCPISVRDLAFKIGTLLNKPELISLGARPYRDAEPMFICANIGRLRDAIGWSPRFDLETGLKETIEWSKTRVNASTITGKKPNA